MIGNNGSRYLSFLNTIRFGWLYGVEQDNINGDEDEEGDRDQEPADNFKSLGPSHPPWRDQHEDQAVLEEGKEDDQEAGKHPDVDEGGVGDEGHAALDTVVQGEDAEQHQDVHPAPQADPIDWGDEVGEVGDDGEEEGGQIEHEDVVVGQPL